jgi:translation initiation factor IF-2
MKRIHELAKEQGVDATAIIEVLKRAGLPASKCTPASTISEDWEKRLSPIFERLRDAERRRLEKERQAAAVVSRTKKSTAQAAAPAAAPVKGHGHAAAHPAKGAAAQAAAPTSASTRAKKTSGRQPKRWTDDQQGETAAASVSSELDAWVEAGPRKPKARREKVTEEAAPEEVSAPPRVPAARPLTPEEIVRAAGLTPISELPAEPPAAPVAEVAAPAPAAAPAIEEEPPAAPPKAPELERPAEPPVREAPPVAEKPAEAPAAPAPVPAIEPAAPAAERPAPATAPLAPPPPPMPAGADIATLAEIARRDREAARAARDAKEKAERERKEREAAAAAAAAAAAEARAARAAAAAARKKEDQEISPAAKALARALEQKRRQEEAAARGEPIPAAEAFEEEEGLPVGEALLGEIPEEDEELTAAVGLVPEGPTKKGPIPIVRRDKRPLTPQAGGPGKGPVKTGFKQGAGFNVALAGPQAAPPPARGGRGPAPAQGAPPAGRGRQFFKMQSAGGGRHGTAAPQKFERPTKVTLSPPFTVKELSTAMGVRVPDIIGRMMKKGKMLRLNDPINEELALEIGLDFNVEVEVQRKREAEDELAQFAEQQGAEKPEDLKPRAPVITILGHVDHGKTSLLDRIRKTNVAAGEAGGITQHISAWRVEYNGKPIVFVDTPGHEAFTNMRARGANVTDVAVLVVAADDGVMPQTEEAFNHAKAAGVPVVVALNKVDKPGANPMRVKQQLAGLGLQPVEWGGQTEVIEVSAVTGQGIPDLLETLALQSEILELRANPAKPAIGTCLEARVTEGRGIVAQLLVQQGTLHRGDVIICGTGYGKVRAIFDDKGRQLPEAGPATPVEVIGLEEVPEAGAKFYVLDDLAKAKEIALQRLQRKRLEQIADRTHVTLDNIFERLKAGATKEVRVVIKADVKGSIEVLSKELPALSTNEVKVKLLHAGVGGITESDVLLADASDAVVIGFNVVADEKAKATAEQKGVDIRTYRVIYQITDDLKKAMEGLLEPEERETVTAHVEIRKTFKASQIGTIAGCYVQKGKLERSNKVRLIRDGVIKFEGEIASLKRLKDDVKEVREGLECGVVLKNYNDIQEGDRLEAYTVEKVARTLK